MRFKQIARKSTGGKAPRRQLATRVRDAVIESNHESDEGDFPSGSDEQPFKQTARKSTGGLMPRRQLATRARDVVIQSNNEAASESDEGESVISADVRPFMRTARKSTGGHMPRRQFAVKARRAIIESKSAAIKSKNEANFTEGKIVVIDENTDPTTRLVHLGSDHNKMKINVRLFQFTKEKWCRFEDGYYVMRSTDYCPVVKIKLDCLPPNFWALINGQIQNDDVSIFGEDSASESSHDCNEPPAKIQKLEKTKVEPKQKPFNFTKGEIVVIDANTDSAIRTKYFGRLMQFTTARWYRVEGDFYTMRSTDKHPVVKIKHDFLPENVKELIKYQTHIGDDNTKDKPVEREPVVEKPAETVNCVVDPVEITPLEHTGVVRIPKGEPKLSKGGVPAKAPASNSQQQMSSMADDQGEFEIIEYLGPEIHVPENQYEPVGIEVMAEYTFYRVLKFQGSFEQSKETITSSEVKKSDLPDVIVID
ncbi:unnamed protein product [Oikopleura dioica]|uniref:Uncharacterized protein n=1 Tax=Oikopleura dioica TaxID=34765 RepID=E4YSV3_OIKDI|nr:unnamed protein product [Oikopleura dioica]